MKLVSIFSLSALTQVTTAHFLLNYPPTLGFDDDNEGIDPCGGFPVVFNSSDVQVQVDGFPIALRSIHPEADWLFRATLSQNEPFNWINLLPVVHEIGLGDFCIPDFTVPAEFVGHSGLLQVMQDAVDGILYQCAAVNFVTGVNSSVGSGCSNVTGLTTTITNQNMFSNISNASAITSMGMASTTGSASAASPTSSSSLATPHLHTELGLRAAVAMALAALCWTGSLAIFV